MRVQTVACTAGDPQVYKAIRHGTSEVAVKHMDCLVDDPQKLHQMRREIAIMKKISYDANIVQFYGACTTDSGAWLMMEYMEVSRSCPVEVVASMQLLCAAVLRWSVQRCMVLAKEAAFTCAAHGMRVGHENAMQGVQ